MKKGSRPKGERLKSNDIQKSPLDKHKRRWKPEIQHQWGRTCSYSLFINLPFKINCWWGSACCFAGSGASGRANNLTRWCLTSDFPENSFSGAHLQSSAAVCRQAKENVWAGKNPKTFNFNCRCQLCVAGRLRDTAQFILIKFCAKHDSQSSPKPRMQRQHRRREAKSASSEWISDSAVLVSSTWAASFIKSLLYFTA